MEPERGENSRRMLSETLLPVCEVRWLQANDIHTLQELVCLPLDQIRRLEAFKEPLLAPLCLMARVEGVSIGGMSRCQMEEVIVSILGHLPEDPAAALMTLEGFQVRHRSHHADVCARFVA